MTGIHPLRSVARVALFCVVGAIIGLGSAYAMARLNRVYISSALYEFLPLESGGMIGGALGAGGRDEMDRFIANQLAAIESDPVLQRVARDTRVLGTGWAQAVEREDGAPSDGPLVRALRRAIEVERLGETNLVELRVGASAPEDAGILAEAIDDSYRMVALQALTRASEPLIASFELRSRALRQDVAAFDIRIGNIIVENNLTGQTIGQTGAYIERRELIARLAGVRAELAERHPGWDENNPTGPIEPESEGMRRLEESLRSRIATLNGRLVETTGAVVDLENFRSERALRLEGVQHADRAIGELGERLSRGARVRVIAEPRVPEASEGVPVWPSVGIGAGLCALLGVLIEVVRR